MSLLETIMQRDLVTATGSESVAAAVHRLGSRDVGALLVVNEGRLAGVLSERDVLRRVIAPGRDPAFTRISEVATPDPISVGEDASIKQCTSLIREHGFRHLPVVDRHERPIGIISSRDLLQFVVEGLESYIERYRAEQHREEMTDPYDGLIP